MIVKLGSVISEYSVRNKQDEDIPVYSVTNEQGFCTGYFSKDVSSKDRTNYKVVPYGYFAYNPSRINVGSVDWQHCKDRVIVSPLYIVFKVEDSIDQRYLLHFLKSDVALTLIKANASGSVRDNLKLSTLQEFPINLQSIEEQRRVADIWDKIDALLSLCKQEIETLDELVKSRFIELFGDPILNDRKLPTLSGENFFKLSNGKAVPEEKRLEAGVPAYGGNGISWYTNEFLMAEDTIVVGRVGFQSGNVHYAAGPLWITDNAMYISQYDKNKFNLIFLCELMQHVNFSRFQDAGDLKKITQKPFMSFEYVLPSMELQQQFVDFKAQVDKSKHFSEWEVAA